MMSSGEDHRRLSTDAGTAPPPTAESTDDYLIAGGFFIELPHDGPKANRWGLQTYVNPSVDRPAALIFQIPSSIPRYGPVPDSTKLGDHVWYLAFDLSQHLESQLKAARASLRRTQRRLQERGALCLAKPARARPSLWPSYLRLLDAAADGVPVAGKIFSEVVQKKEPENWGIEDGSIRERLAVAKRLTKPEGYLTAR